MEDFCMSPNIKNREAHDLARELATLTGKPMTTVVIEALRDRLERERREHGSVRAERLLAIGRDCARRLREPYRSVDHGDLLYDDEGLPR